MLHKQKYLIVEISTYGEISMLVTAVLHSDTLSRG